MHKVFFQSSYCEKIVLFQRKLYYFNLFCCHVTNLDYWVPKRASNVSNWFWNVCQYMFRWSGGSYNYWWLYTKSRDLKWWIAVSLSIKYIKHYKSNYLQLTQCLGKWQSMKQFRSTNSFNILILSRPQWRFVNFYLRPQCFEMITINGPLANNPLNY